MDKDVAALSLPELVAEYAVTRESRRQLQTSADRLEQREKDILYQLTKTATPGHELQLDGGGYRMNLSPKRVLTVNNWPVLLDYIRDTQSLDIFQKRVTESAVYARIDNGADVPGVELSKGWGTPKIVVLPKESK